MVNKAFDENGNEVFPIEIKTIAPIGYSEQAKEISHQFMVSIGGDDSVESMLPIFLKPIGTEIPTHVFCSRDSYTHELNSQLQFMANKNQEWISGVLETEPERILSLFCTFSNDLQSLGLEVC